VHRKGKKICRDSAKGDPREISYRGLGFPAKGTTSISLEKDDVGVISNELYGKAQEGENRIILEIRSGRVAGESSGRDTLLGGWEREATGLQASVIIFGHLK